MGCTGCDSELRREWMVVTSMEFQIETAGRPVGNRSSIIIHCLLFLFFGSLLTSIPSRPGKYTTNRRLSSLADNNKLVGRWCPSVSSFRFVISIIQSSCVVSIHHQSKDRLYVVSRSSLNTTTRTYIYIYIYTHHTHLSSYASSWVEVVHKHLYIHLSSKIKGFD